MLPEQLSIIKKSWPTWTKVLVGLGVAILLAIFALLASLYINNNNKPSPIKFTRDAQEPKVEILTTTDEAKLGDIFGVDVKADSAGKEITNIKFYVDGILKDTCESENECSFTSGPFSEDDIGGHKYETEFNYSDGTSYTKSGTFSVTEKNSDIQEDTSPGEVETVKPTNAPKIQYFYTSNNYLSEGDVLASSLAVEDVTKIDYLDIQIDGESKKICADASICSLSLIITKNLNLGKHSITGRAIGTNGLISYITKSFYLVEKVTPEDEYIAPSIGISPSKTQIDSNETISFSAIVNPGSKTLQKIQINVDFTTVQECTANACNYKGGPYPQFAGLSVPYNAVAYFTDGTYINTGLKMIQINAITPPDDSGAQPEPEPVQPTPDTQAPVVTVKSNNASTLNNEQVIITAQATDNKSISKIIILVDGKTSKTCYHTSICVATIGPWPELVTQKTILFSASAYDSSLNYAWSGYSSIQVNIPDQIIEPTINIKKDKEVVLTNETFNVTATVNSGSKTLKHIEITIQPSGIIYKICYISTCVLSDGPYTDTGLKNYKATAYFTDGTSLNSDILSVTINQGEVPIVEEPTISISFSPNQASVTASTHCTISSIVNPNGKVIVSHKIWSDKGYLKTCYTENCSYSATAATMLGYTPSRTPGTLSVISTVLFNDSTSIMIQATPVTVTGD